MKQPCKSGRFNLVLSWRFLYVEMGCHNAKMVVHEFLFEKAFINLWVGVSLDMTKSSLRYFILKSKKEPLFVFPPFHFILINLMHKQVLYYIYIKKTNEGRKRKKKYFYNKIHYKWDCNILRYIKHIYIMVRPFLQVNFLGLWTFVLAITVYLSPLMIESLLNLHNL